MKAVAAATRVATAPFARRDTFKGPVSRGPSSPVVGPVASVKTSRTGNMAKKPNVAARMLSLGMMSSSRGDESGKLRAFIDPDAATNAQTVTAGDMWRLAQEKRSAATALSKFAATCQVFSAFAQLSAAHEVEEAWREVEDAEEAARTFLAQETAPQNPDVGGLRYTVHDIVAHHTTFTRHSRHESSPLNFEFIHHLTSRLRLRERHPVRLRRHPHPKHARPGHLPAPQGGPVDRDPFLARVRRQSERNRELVPPHP